MKLKSLIFIGVLTAVTFGSVSGSPVTRDGSSSINKKIFKVSLVAVASLVLLPSVIAVVICIIAGTDQFGFEIHRILFKIRKFRSEFRWRNIFRIGMSVDDLECSAQMKSKEREMFYAGDL